MVMKLLLVESTIVIRKVILTRLYYHGRMREPIQMLPVDNAGANSTILLGTNS